MMELARAFVETSTCAEKVNLVKQQNIQELETKGKADKNPMLMDALK